jgi:hypothetical protein
VNLRNEPISALPAPGYGQIDDDRGHKRGTCSGGLEPLELVEGLGELAAHVGLVPRDPIHFRRTREQPLATHVVQISRDPAR